MARLKDGISLEQAQAQMDQIAVALEKANPQWNKENLIGVRPLVDHVVGARTKSWMMMLLGAVGIVLLIACANVANLFLARATSREREIGIRAALGASRLRLVQQMLIESLVLSAAGTVCAVVVAWWAVGVLKASMPAAVPRVTTIALDLRILAAAAGLSLVTGILFGIVPALQVSKPDVSNALKDSAHASTGPARGRLRSGLVIAEVALAVVLLVGAALFIGSFVAIMRIEPGFSGEHVLIAQVSPRIESRTEPRDAAGVLADIVERISHIPGVLHASMIGGMVPLQGGYSATSLTIPAKNIDLTAGEMIVTTTVTNDRDGPAQRRRARCVRLDHWRHRRVVPERGGQGVPVQGGSHGSPRLRGRAAATLRSSARREPHPRAPRRDRRSDGCPPGRIAIGRHPRSVNRSAVWPA